MVIVLVSPVQPGDTLFVEDFSSGGLDPEWIVYGDPLPEIIDSLGCPAPCFHNNGDTMWDSGVISRRLFDVSAGIVVECDIYMDCDERGTWVTALIGLVTPDFRGTSQEDELRLVEINYSFNGELAWMRPHLQGILRFTAFHDPESKFSCQMYHQNQLMGDWHRFRIELHSDRSIDYYIDDSLYCCSSVGFPDTVKEVRIQLGNRSSDWGIALHDNLRVFVR